MNNIIGFIMDKIIRKSINMVKQKYVLRIETMRVF